MSTRAQRARNTFAEKAEIHGNDLLIGGQTVKAFSEAVAEGKVGLAFLAKMGLGGFAARADPRVFYISPVAFAPTTTLPVPTEITVPVYLGNGYTIRRVEVLEEANEAIVLCLFGHRALLTGDTTGVLPTEAVQLWRQKSLSMLTDPISLVVGDVGETNDGTLPAFFAPMTPEEKMAAIGQVDLRVDRVITTQALKLGDVLYRPGLAETWVTISPSETSPGSGLLIALVKHLDTPGQIAAAQAP